MFQTKVVEQNQNTHLMFSNFSPKILLQMTIRGIRFCMLDN